MLKELISFIYVINKNILMNRAPGVLLILFLATELQGNSQKVISQSLISNIAGRKNSRLNGKWQIIIDPMEAGRTDWRAYYRNEIPKSNTDFKEYAFTDSKFLKVPGDWNSQSPRLYYYEGLIWYKKDF